MRIPLMVKLGALVVGTTLLYTYIGQLVPQKQVLPPQEVLMSADMTTEEMVGVGREIAEGKGLCLTCHTIGKSGALRFPDLGGIGSRAASRIEGVDELSYLSQSLYEPDAYIVEGFSPGMPAMDKPPISLNDQEILAVIAFLQSLGGTATVTLETELEYGGGELSMLGLKLPVIGIIVLVMLLLRWRKVGMLTWVFAWWIALYVGLRYGFQTPVPASVIKLYMGIVSGSLLAYVTSSRERAAAVSGPLIRLIVEPRYRLLLALVVLAVPALVAAQVYASMSVPLEAPLFGRTVHPAPPNEITVHEQPIDLVRAENPFRELEHSAPEEFRQHVDNGRRVYYQNCFYCHGDGLGGDGMFAYGLNPIPTNFTDQGTIPMLQESFLFWRIAKGGPGLPAEGGPWDTAMPAWEKFLTEEEMWDVVLFLYDFTGYKPRAREEHH